MARTHLPQADYADRFQWLLDYTAPDIPKPLREHRFISARKWRFDFYWPEQRLALEIDGGRWKAGGGRHATDGDKAKLNRAAALGIRVLRASPQMLADDPWSLLNDLRAALAQPETGANHDAR